MINFYVGLPKRRTYVCIKNNISIFNFEFLTTFRNMDKTSVRQDYIIEMKEMIMIIKDVLLI